MLLKFNITFQGGWVVNKDLSDCITDLTYVDTYSYGSQSFDKYLVTIDTTKASMLIQDSTNIVVKFKIANVPFKYVIANFGLGKAINYHSKTEQALNYIEYLRQN